MQAGLHSAARRRQQQRRLAFVEPLQITQYQHRAVLRREPRQDIPDVGGKLHIAASGYIDQLIR